MKKILTLTGMLAISSGAGASLINSTDLFSNHQKTGVNYAANSKMDPSRLAGINKNGKSDLKAYDKKLEHATPPEIIGSEYLIFSLTPDDWELISQVRNANQGNDKEGFINWFVAPERGYNITSEITNDHSVDVNKNPNWMRRIAEVVFFDNFTYIAQKFTQSSRSQRVFVDLTIASWRESIFGGRSYRVTYNDSYIDAEIDNIKYTNTYFENLKTDFNGDYEENKVISLGTLRGLEFGDSPIWVAIGAKYPKIIKHMQEHTKLSLKERTDFNPNENYTYSFVLYIDYSNAYTIGRVNIKFIYTTEELLNKIMPDLIKENGVDLLGTWNAAFEQWHKNVLDQWENSYPHKTPEEQKEWKQNVFDTLNDKIHALIQDFAIIDLRIKVKHLYEVLKELEKDVQDIQLQVNNLERLVLELIKGQTSGHQKENLAQLQKLISSLTTAAGLIPGAGTAMAALGLVINTILGILW